MAGKNTYYGIGDIIPLHLIETIKDYYNKVGTNSFWDFIYHGGFENYAMAYSNV